MNTILRTAFTLSAIALAGCDSSSTASGAAASTTLTPKAYFAGQFTASCSHQLKCCTDAELKAEYPGGDAPKSAADCQKTGDSIAALFGASIDESITAKRQAYDGAKAAACVNAFKSLACVPTAADAGAFARCAGVLTPLVELGGGCRDNDDCKAGACAGEPGKEGKCANPPKQGEDCSTASCSSSLYCDQNAKCAKYKADGTACSAGSECESGNCAGTDPDKKCAKEAAGPATCDGK